MFARRIVIDKFFTRIEPPRIQVVRDGLTLLERPVPTAEEIEDVESDIDDLYSWLKKEIRFPCSRSNFGKYVRIYKYVQTPVSKFLARHSDEVAKCLCEDYWLVTFDTRNPRELHTYYNATHKQRLDYDTFVKYYDAYKNGTLSPINKWLRSCAISMITASFEGREKLRFWYHDTATSDNIDIVCGEFEFSTDDDDDVWDF